MCALCWRAKRRFLGAQLSGHLSQPQGAAVLPAVRPSLGAGRFTCNTSITEDRIGRSTEGVRLECSSSPRNQAALADSRTLSSAARRGAYRPAIWRPTRPARS